MKSFKFLLFSILGLILFGIGFTGGKTLFNLNNITTEISKSDEDLGIDKSSLLQIETLKKEDEEVINIALFGIDTRVENSDSGTRSDSIIILTIDQIHKEIKLSSIMRDTYVSVPGYSKTKINHAYAYGGPQLAIKTLNSNFGLDIRNFVTVDFFGLEKIIDAIGGITLTIKDSEIDEINKYIKEVASIDNRKPKLLKNGGIQKVNGMQAVSYGRIRKVGNGDYERTQRQRQVLMAIFDEVKNISPSQAMNLANTCTPYVKTSLDISEGIKLALSILKDNYTIKQDRFPYDNASEGQTRNGMWILAANIPQTKKDILNFIYGSNLSSSNSYEDSISFEEYYDDDYDKEDDSDSKTDDFKDTTDNETSIDIDKDEDKKPSNSLDTDTKPDTSIDEDINDDDVDIEVDDTTNDNTDSEKEDNNNNDNNNDTDDTEHIESDSSTSNNAENISNPESNEPI